VVQGKAGLQPQTQLSPSLSRAHPSRILFSKASHSPSHTPPWRTLGISTEKAFTQQQHLEGKISLQVEQTKEFLFLQCGTPHVLRPRSKGMHILPSTPSCYSVNLHGCLAACLPCFCSWGYFSNTPFFGLPQVLTR
jgi:hypothetical protein